MVMKKFICTHCGRRFEAEEKEVMECPGCFWSTSVREENEMDKKGHAEEDILLNSRGEEDERKRITERILSILLVLGIFGFIILKAGVFQNKGDTRSPDDIFVSKRSEAMSHEIATIASLVAFKYKVDINTATQILKDWGNIISGNLEDGKIVLPHAHNTEEVINALSEKYKIQTSTIADLIITALSLKTSVSSSAEDEAVESEN